MTDDSCSRPMLVANCASDADARLNACLRIHDELVYIIECLLQDLTGEAKGEFHHLHLAIDAAPCLPAAVREELHATATNFRERMVWPADDRQLPFDIATLRRRLFNTIAAMRGFDAYNCAPAFEVS